MVSMYSFLYDAYCSFLAHLNTISQTLNNKIMALNAAVNVLHIICCGLKMAGRIVAL